MMRAGAQARTDPPLRKRSAPVFIHDAVTPWGQDTVLLAMMRAQIKDAEYDDPR